MFMFRIEYEICYFFIFEENKDINDIIYQINGIDIEEIY